MVFYDNPSTKQQPVKFISIFLSMRPASCKWTHCFFITQVRHDAYCKKYSSAKERHRKMRIKDFLLRLILHKGSAEEPGLKVNWESLKKYREEVVMKGIVAFSSLAAW